MKNIISSFSRTKKIFAACVATVAVTVATLVGIGLGNAEAGDCTANQNSIIACGFTTSQDFINKVRANNSLNPTNHRDLQVIYNHFGLSADKYDRFVNEAMEGTVYGDGRIIVGDQVVATDAISLGRTTLGGRQRDPLVIGGTTYYSSPTSISLITHDAFPVKVLFNNDGNVEFAVMKECGNPTWGTPIVSDVKCDMLNKTAVSGKDNTYSFTTASQYTGNATITKYVYEFSDGYTKTTDNGSTPVEHTFGYGTHTVKVTVYASVPGNHTISRTSETCQITFNIEKPKVPAVTIEKWVNGLKQDEVEANENFTYKIKARNSGETELKDVVITDDAPTGVQFISSDKGTVADNKLSYTAASLPVGQSVEIHVTAKAVTGGIKAINKACVETPTIPATNPDDCDEATVTVKEPKVPGVKIEKWVNGVKRDEVDVAEIFTYKIKVTNTGETDLCDVVVKDPIPSGVTAIAANGGTINDGKFTMTISSLKVGESKEATFTAKVDQYKAGDIINTACVYTKEVNPTKPSEDDGCDSAWIKVREPGMVTVCDPKTGDKIQVSELDQDKYKPANSIECTRVTVCDPSTGNILDGIKYIDKDKYLPADSDKCIKMQFCVIADGTGVMNTITKDQYDASKYSTKSADCTNIPVCRLSDKSKVTIKESQFNSTVYSKTLSDCDVKPQVLPATTLPNTGAGDTIGIFLGTSLAAGLFHRFFIRRKIARD